MKIIHAIAACGISALALAGCQTAQESMQESGAVQLEKTQVAALYTDQTVPWASGKGASYHAPDGSYVYKSNSGDTGNGTWRVSDTGNMCIDVAAWGGETCYEIWDENGTIYFIDPKGKKSKRSESTTGNTL